RSADGGARLPSRCLRPGASPGWFHRGRSGRGGGRLHPEGAMMGSADAWRGVASSDDHDDVEETVTAGLAGLFRARSRRLLAELVRPHRRALLRVGFLVVVAQAASLTGPLLVRLGI